MPSGHRSAGESRIEWIAKMGPELGSLYAALWQEVVWAWRKWDEYVELFGTNEQRINLLNEAAPGFFRLIQDSLWEDVLLHVARLTDSPKSAGRQTLSIRQLSLAVSHAEVRPHVEAAITHALATSKFCRDWRNRHIAHRDLRLALDLDEGAKPLETASRLAVREALESLAEVLNTVEIALPRHNQPFLLRVEDRRRH